MNLRNRIPLILGLIVLILTLVFLAWSFLSAPESQPMPEEGEASSPPVIELKYQDKVYAGKQGSYCWPKKGGTLCADTLFPESSEIISVKQGDELMVAIDATNPPKTLSASTFVYKDQSPIKTFSLVNGLNPLIQLDHPLGTYFFVIFGTWEEGDISYGFKIDVQSNSPN